MQTPATCNFLLLQLVNVDKTDRKAEGCEETSEGEQEILPCCFVLKNYLYLRTVKQLKQKGYAGN